MGKNHSANEVDYVVLYLCRIKALNVSMWV